MALCETLGFLGFGNMGTAIGRGLLAQQTLAAKDMWAYDVDESRCDEARAMGLTVAPSATQLVEACTTVVLAVKPQMMADAVQHLPADVLAGKRVVSIAAGVSIATLHKLLGESVRAIRVMPNTPALVGAGAAAMALGPTCSAGDAEVARAIFEAVGICEQVKESDMDAVTALSGSGPAYFFRMVECLVQAAVDEGLSESQATRLATQTAFGAGKLLRDSGEPAATLRARVTSKGGTTAAALAAFDDHHFVETIRAGVQAAATRSRELGR